MPLRIISCDNFEVDNTTPENLDVKDHPWHARLSTSQFVFVKVLPIETPRSLTISFSAAATDNDVIAVIADEDEAEFTFGDGTGGTVDKGLDEIDSATNLAAALEDFFSAIGFLAAVSDDAAGTLTITIYSIFLGLAFNDPVDDGGVITITQLGFDEEVTEDDGMPTNEFEDVVIDIGYGETLSVLGSEPDTFVSVAEVMLSS